MHGIIGQTTHLTAFDFIILTSKYLNTLYRKAVQASICETSIVPHICQVIQLSLHLAKPVVQSNHEYMHESLIWLPNLQAIIHLQES